MVVIPAQAGFQVRRSHPYGEPGRRPAPGDNHRRWCIPGSPRDTVGSLSVKNDSKARMTEPVFRTTEPVLRVTATPAALELIAKLEARHGPLMFHQSGGCCDGSAPMCYPRGEFIVGDYDRRLGEIGGTPFYISGPQFEYWQHTALIIDVVPGRGGMFSLEGPEGLRFLTRSRLFSEAEWATLQAEERAQAA
jgi:uncharacterized protein (DUF779 family)